MWVMFLDEGTKFMQAIADVSKVPYFHLQCRKLKTGSFSCSFVCFWEASVKTQFVLSIPGVYVVYGLRCLGKIKPNYLFTYSFKTVYLYLRKHFDHYTISFQLVITFQRT